MPKIYDPFKPKKPTAADRALLAELRTLADWLDDRAMAHDENTTYDAMRRRAALVRRAMVRIEEGIAR